MFKIIRCGSDFGLVIAVTPYEAGPFMKEARYYRLANWEIGEHEPGVFNEIGRTEALGYFSGHGDGCGFENFPQDDFETLDDIRRWAEDSLVLKRGSEVDGRPQDPRPGTTTSSR